MNKKFDVDHWRSIIDEISIERHIISNMHIGQSICGPIHYFSYEFYRKIIENGLTDYEIAPCDIFIWGKGCNLNGTQLGGLPNIPLDLWPRSNVDSSHLNFICQIDFSDSHDIVKVPANYMLLFANFIENCLEEFEILWLESCDFAGDCNFSDSFLRKMLILDPFYGEIHRTHNLVNHEGLMREIKEVFQKNKISFQDYSQIACANATMIGNYVSLNQSDYVSSIDSQIVCKIHSFDSFSSQQHMYPWLNRKELDHEEMDSNSACNFSTFGRTINRKKFLLGDGGGIAIEKTSSGQFVANMYFYS